MEATDPIDADVDGNADIDPAGDGIATLSGNVGEKLALASPEAETSCNIITTTSSEVVCETEPLNNPTDALLYNKQDRLLRISVEYNRWETIDPSVATVVRRRLGFQHYGKVSDADTYTDIKTDDTNGYEMAVDTVSRVETPTVAKPTNSDGSNLSTVTISGTSISLLGPNERTRLKFTLDNKYTKTLTIDDISIYIHDSSVNNFSVQLPVLSVDNTSTSARTFTAFYTGVPMKDTYKFYFVSKLYGELKVSSENDMKLVVKSTITNITPLFGSILGGSKLTITGTKFPVNKADFKVTVGNHLCNYISHTTTVIVCRIAPTGLSPTTANPP